MRIGINAHLLSLDQSYRATGVSNYILRLLHGLSAVDRENRYTVFTGTWARRREIRERLALTSNFHIAPARFPTAAPPARLLWEQTAQPMHSLPLDVLHNPVNVIPMLTRTRQVVTIHDLAFLHYSDKHSRSKRNYLSVMTKLSARRANAIITDSEYTRQDVIRLLNVAESRVITIPLAADASYHAFDAAQQGELADFRTRKGLPEHFFLYMGTLEPRKNIPLMLQGYAHFLQMWTGSEEPPHLVIAGPKGWMYDSIFELVRTLDLTRYVQFPGFLPQEEAIWWMNAAMGFVYLSAFEGFGMPPLEAMACGVPVIVNDSTSLPEVVGEDGLKVKAEDPNAVASAFHLLATSPDVRIELKQRGIARAAQFSWERTARETLRVYEAVYANQKLPL